MKSKGQSMVEFAIILPILVFFLLGVLELGWVLRNYLVLANVSREAARFAARPGYLHPESQHVGFEQVYTHAIQSVSNQLETEKLVLIVSIIKIDTQFPCDPDNLAHCDCIQARTQPYSPTIIYHPGMVSYTHYISTFPYSSTEATWLDFSDLSLDMIQQERQFNCQIMKNDVSKILRLHTMVTAELMYEHHQLFGFPLIANPYTDPVVLYASTSMRILEARTPLELVTPEITPTTEE